MGGEAWKEGEGEIKKRKSQNGREEEGRADWDRAGREGKGKG